jgi:serine/threonine protein kinase
MGLSAILAAEHPIQRLANERTHSHNFGRRTMSEPALAQGAILGSRYEIVAYLGEGGMGLVYKAHDRTLDEVVAIKVLRPQLLDSQLMRQRFLSEIKLARRVSHRNVCRIHDYGEDGSLDYISMQFVDGVELTTLVRPPAGVSVDEAYEIAIQLADGLQAIHDARIVHRDFKSANVMVDAQGNPRLMDFGIAKLVESQPGAGLTLDGHFIGTPEYMSPEQASGESLDPRSDLYSMGIVLFELFTGTRPFRADHAMAVLYKQLYEEPPLDSPAAAAIPAAVKPILHKALAKRRDDRFVTADELKQALLDARSTRAANASDTTNTIVARVQHLRGSRDTSLHESTATPQPASPAPVEAERPRRITRRALWYLLTATSAIVIAAVSAPSLLTRRVPANDAERAQTASGQTSTDRPSTTAEPPKAGAAGAPIERDTQSSPGRPVDKRDLPGGETARAQPSDANPAAACERNDAGACLEACNGQVPAACTQLGVLYNRGIGVAKDLGTAALYYERGCAGGDPAGCNNLGTVYQFGALGFRADWSKAAGFYERACNGGHLDACANLGALYLDEPDASAQQRTRGRALLQQACSAGISRACSRIGA